MSDADLTLTNCAAEPIHIPGSIQPHGALLAFSAQPSLGAELASLNLPLAAVELIHEAGADLDAGRLRGD